MLFEDLTSSSGRAKRSRSPAPTAAANRACCGSPPACSGAERGRVERATLALADDHLALDRELPLRRALAVLGRRRSTPRWKRSALRAWPRSRCACCPRARLKRATLARVAASGAPLWLLDEPLNALDAAAAAQLARVDRGASRARRRGARRLAPAASRQVARAGARRVIGALILRDLRRGLDRRGVAADRLLPAGRGPGPLRGRARRAAARAHRRRAPCGSPR